MFYKSRKKISIFLLFPNILQILFLCFCQLLLYALRSANDFLFTFFLSLFPVASSHRHQATLSDALR